jgi:Flp pilus assembly protein TadG
MKSASFCADNYKVASDSRGTTIVEFAIILPIFLALVFGIFEYGLRMHQVNAIRTGSEEGGRAAAVGGPFGYIPSGDCDLTGVGAGTPAANVICFTKELTGLDPAKTRVSVSTNGGYVVGGDILVCVQYQHESVTGFTEMVPLTDKIGFAQHTIRLDNLGEDPSGAETAFADWSGCGA